MLAMADTESLRVDARGRLVAASPRLAALNARAGGARGKPLALPPLAALAALARTLSVDVARTVRVADGPLDAELHIDARPTGDFSDLVVGAWHERAPRSSWLVAQPRDLQQTLPAPPWRWATDATLVITRLDLDPVETPGLASDDLLGFPLTRLVRLIDDEAGDLPMLRALGAGLPFHGQRAVRRDRPDIEYALAARPEFDGEGRFAGLTGNATAVTESSSVEPETSDFGLRLSRALRDPLDRIVSRAASIGAQHEGPLRRDYADYAGDIADAGRHLLALVDDLVDLEAVERPDFLLASEAIDLADIARRAAGLLAVRAQHRNVRIDRPAQDEELPASGDFRRVLQILVNLIGNAVRYSPDGAMVWLRTERDGESAVVIVADQGKGIATDDQARIFEKFERVDPTEPGGSGLGLYISRRLARAMGGDVSVDSAPGQGARFMLTLPTS